jgi:hypothetical protein
LYFLYEKGKLLPVDSRELSNYADFILSHPNVSLRLVSQSNESKILSNSRLEYIKDYFVDKGINRNRISNSIYVQDSTMDYSEIELEFLDSYYSLKPSNSIINNYIEYVDSLKSHKALVKFHLPNMSVCSGSLTGYYYKNKLVYMSSQYVTELGYSEKQVYLKYSVVYKVRYREHFAKWDEFYEKFEDSEKNASEMNYTDTLYTFVLYNQPKLFKTSGTKFIKTEYDYVLQNRLLDCAIKMTEELKEEKGVK